jgi:hypothetical protein
MTLRMAKCLSFAFACIPLAAVHAETPRATAGSATVASDGQHDFDFYFGQWSGAQHKLKQRLVNSNDWEDFNSTIVVRPLLGGRANTDQVVFEGAKPGGGATFRLYDPDKRLWSIYWIGTNSYTLEAPVTGRFSGNRGEFYGDDTWEGKPIRVRFLWTKVDLTHARWEQAFSTDGGKSWETNWTVDWTRSAF